MRPKAKSHGPPAAVPSPPSGVEEPGLAARGLGACCPRAFPISPCLGTARAAGRGGQAGSAQARLPSPGLVGRKLPPVCTHDSGYGDATRQAVCGPRDKSQGVFARFAVSKEGGDKFGEGQQIYFSRTGWGGCPGLLGTASLSSVPVPHNCPPTCSPGARQAGSCWVWDPSSLTCPVRARQDAQSSGLYP